MKDMWHAAARLFGPLLIPMAVIGTGIHYFSGVAQGNNRSLAGTSVTPTSSQPILDRVPGDKPITLDAYVEQAPDGVAPKARIESAPTSKTVLKAYKPNP